MDEPRAFWGKGVEMLASRRKRASAHGFATLVDLVFMKAGPLARPWCREDVDGAVDHAVNELRGLIEDNTGN
jgi:hypothetical protein